MITSDLTQRIEIYSNSQVPNAYGGTDPNNTLYWSTFAHVKQLRSSRTQEANQSPLKQVFSFSVRYRNDRNIENDMLLKWRKSWYIIQGYVPDVVYREYVKFDAVTISDVNIVTGNTT